MAKTATRQTMDEEHCVIAVIDSEVAKFRMPQINAVTTSFLYVPLPVAQVFAALPHPLDPSLSRGFGGAETTVQNYEFILNRQKIIFPDSGFRRRGKVLCGGGIIRLHE